jgi:hypothetical protein
MERRMDTRLGERVALQCVISIVATRPRLASIGRLLNLSRSGALIAGCDLQLFSLIQVDLGPHRGSQPDEARVSAYVTRVDQDGVGIEWCEFAPPAVTALLGATAHSLDPLRHRQSESGLVDGAPAAPLQTYLH